MCNLFVRHSKLSELASIVGAIRWPDASGSRRPGNIYKYQQVEVGFSVSFS